MFVKYNKKEWKTKIWELKRTEYEFKLYWNNWKDYFVVRFNGSAIMPMVYEAYVAKHWFKEWTERFEEMLEMIDSVQEKWYNPFWLFKSKYISKDSEQK